MTPEQASFLLHEVYLPQLRTEQKTTKRIIAAIPADKCDHRPDPKSMTAWDLATHVASAEIFFLSGISKGAFERADGAIPESVKTPAELAAWYEESFTKAIAKLAATSAEDLAKPTTFAVYTLPAASYGGFLMSHSLHHRGQLSAYLRPMGAKVPRIYGGSADEPVEHAAEAH